MVENPGKNSCSFYRNQLKSEIRLRVFRNSQWQECGVQLPLHFFEDESSVLQRIFELKNHYLLLDVYDLIFQQGHAYQDVYPLLHEILSSLDLLEEFKPWIDDSGTMMITALREHDQYVLQQTQEDQLIS